jgi:hypothetical protein
MCLHAVVEFGESRLFKQRWQLTPQLCTVASLEIRPEAAEDDDDDWITPAVETRSKILLSEASCADLRDTAVHLCMLACGDALCLTLGTCESKAVQLYDDAQIRDSIFRFLGEVSRSQFGALCAEAYAYRKHLITKVLLPQKTLDRIYAKKAWLAHPLFERYKETAEYMPWQYWAISDADLLLEKSRRFTLQDRLVSNLTAEEIRNL